MKFQPGRSRKAKTAPAPRVSSAPFRGFAFKKLAKPCTPLHTLLPGPAKAGFSVQQPCSSRNRLAGAVLRSSGRPLALILRRHSRLRIAAGAFTCSKEEF